MARSRETKIELTAYDDLFQTDESREEAKLSKIRDIPISEIDEFPDHPFKVLMDEDMEQLVESIKRNGVMTPATVRLKEDGRYELISGHRRKKACELAGLETLKCEVKELTRDEAIIVMVESNLQRSVILPSEKAFAYKMRLEAMKRQAGRPPKENASPLATNLSKGRSDEELGELVGESKDQIRRYIRLTELVPEILQMVDERQIAFRPAVEVSYLTEEQQYTLLEAMEYNDATPSLAQAIKMKKYNQDGKLTSEVIQSIMEEEKPNQKEAMFLEYSELLNSLDSGATTKITINNRRLNKADFEQTILIPMADDGLDKYRKEYNKMLLDKATGANSIVQDKYVTVSVCKKNIEEARNYFARVGADLIAHFNRLGSKCVELDAGDKLRIFHDFYRTGEETAFHFDITQTMRKGHDFKDFICPDTFEFESDCFRMGDRYGRVIFLREYAAYIKDSMVAELCELNRNMMLSVDIIPVPTDEAVQEVENRLLGVETNITNWQRKQNQNNNFSAVIPYDLEQQRKESKEFLDDLTTRDQRMMFAVLTMVHTADTKEQLDNDTEALLTTARKHLCQFAVLKYQQMDGLNTALPFGVRKIDALRTLTTESLAVFIPFRVQEIYHENGVYYGQNVISKNMIIANRRQLLNGNSFILGVSGAGKSFTAKEEMTNIILTDPNADIIIIDPEREYSPLVKAMQGEVIHISATSENHINAMDMNSDYGDGANPVILKSEFILSLCEQLIGGTNLGAKQKSIIDRCTASVYRYYQQGNYMGTPPTLQDFREELLKQNEPEAQEIALAIELFTDGSLNTFAKHTNVDTHSRLICYDILDLGKQLQPIGMLVVLDSILNRITQNRAKGRNTFIFIDEIYLLFQHEYSANFLFTLWKRVRKYGAYCTGITQNVDDLLQSHTARTMLANSEFIIMLNQASTDRLELAKLLNISDLQMSYITNVGAGQGLLKVGSSLVPFVNKFPRNTELYKLMTTKFGEV